MSIKRARMHRVFFNDDIYTNYEDQKAKKKPIKTLRTSSSLQTFAYNEGRTRHKY